MAADAADAVPASRHDIATASTPRRSPRPPGARLLSETFLGGPALDFVALARGMGVPGERGGAEVLAAALRRALAEPGPHLVQAVLRR